MMENQENVTEFLEEIMIKPSMIILEDRFKESSIEAPCNGRCGPAGCKAF